MDDIRKHSCRGHFSGFGSLHRPLLPAGLVLLLLGVVALGPHLAGAQPSQTPCPPGQAAQRAIYPDGTFLRWCVPISRAKMPNDPKGQGYISTCNQDSDCPGPARCESGTCGRTNVACKSNGDCKSNEFCSVSDSSSTALSGRCLPQGGHY